MAPSAYPSACVSFCQSNSFPTKVSILAGSSSPRLSAQPFTQTPRCASRFQVCTPLAQTICCGPTGQSFGKASALAIQSAIGFWLPLPLGEGPGEGVESWSDTDALTLTLSQRER